MLYNGFPSAPDPVPVPALDEKEPLAIFNNTSGRAATDCSNEGLYKADADASPRAAAKPVPETTFPASDQDVWARAGVAPRAALKENYVFEYPDWVRLIVAKGNLYEVFATRSKVKAGDNDRVVGARAAICWADAATGPRPDTPISPRPTAVETKFLRSRSPSRSSTVRATSAWTAPPRRAKARRPRPAALTGTSTPASGARRRSSRSIRRTTVRRP